MNMNKEDLELLEKTLQYANEYFSSYCEFADVYVCEQDEIDSIDDKTERDIAQNLKDYDTLLGQAFDIINKLKGVD